MPIAAARGYRHFLPDSSAINVNITSPAEGAVVTTSTPTIAWTYTPGTQASYRVVVYQGAGVVYDSGIVASAATSMVLPGGILTSGAAYQVRVSITTTTSDTGEGGPNNFTTLFPTSVNITGLAVAPFNSRCVDPADIPAIDVVWNMITPGAGETFLDYLVYRRLARYETAYTLIRQETDITVTAYRDYAVAGNEVYEYYVIWRASTTTGTLGSAIPTVKPSAMVEFDYCFIHDTLDPATYWLRFESFQHDEQREQDLALVQVWGRTSPTAQVGESLTTVMRASGLEVPLQMRLEAWRMIATLQQRQRDYASVLCVRFGRDNSKFFCVITGAGRQVDRETFEPELELREVYHPETITL